MRNMLMVLSLVTIVASCAGVKSPPPIEYAPPVAERSSSAAAIQPVAAVSTKAAVAVRASSDRLIRSRAQLKLETEQPDSIHRELINLTDRYHGHLLHSDLSKTTMRIPDQSLQAALTEIEAMGKLLDREITGGDITEMYKDLNQRLEQLMRRRKRLAAGISQANSQAARERLQAELDEVDVALAQLNLKQDGQAHEVYYALVNVETKRHKKLGAIGWVLSNTLFGVKKLFVLN